MDVSTVKIYPRRGDWVDQFILIIIGIFHPGRIVSVEVAF